METVYEHYDSFVYSKLDIQDCLLLFEDFKLKFLQGSRISGVNIVRINHREDEFHSLQELITSRQASSKLADEIHISVWDKDNSKSSSLSMLINPKNKKVFLRLKLNTNEKECDDVFKEIIKKFSFKKVYDISLLKVKDKAERDYLEEALRARDADAIRGSVVISWNAVMHNIYRRIDKYGTANFIRQLKIDNPKYNNIKPIKSIEDYQQIKDTDIITFSNKYGVINQGVAKQLHHYLDLRNDCGHVRVWKPSEKLIEAFFEFTLNNIFTE